MTSRNARIAVVLSSLCILLTWGSWADEIIVPDDVPTIQQAIAVAANGDVITVRPGTYQGTFNPDGKAITIRSTDPRDPDIVATTILEAEGNPVIEIFRGERRTTCIEGFTIRGGSNDLGGGISIGLSDPTIRDCVFEDNSADRGGAAYFYVSSALFERCIFRDNAARDGGAIYAYACTLPRFLDCSIVSNESTRRGGGIAAEFASMRFDRCEIAMNTAAQNGGAYAGYNSRLLLLNSVVRDNQAERGGAFYADDEGPELRNSTIVRNVATSGSSGALYGFFSQPLIRNSIVRDNGPEPFDGFSVNPTAEYSNTDPLLNGPGNINADPLFVDPDGNDFRLLAGSPSINAGLNGWVPSYALNDLDGRERILDMIADMGAFESGDDEPEEPRPVGQLVAAMKDDANIAFGLPLPIMLYDTNSGEWAELMRNMPTLAIGADAARQCFWLQNGETGLLTRIPYDTLIPEEIALVMKPNGDVVSLSGLAVREGVVYATTAAISEPEFFYTLDIDTGLVSSIAEFPNEYEVWDLHYEPATDQMLIISSSEEQGGPLGIFEIDLDTYQLTEVQSWVNPDPIRQAAAVQGGAAGNGSYYLFRSLYNNIVVIDATSGDVTEELALPDTVPPNGGGWVLGGLTWSAAFDASGSSAQLNSVHVHVGELLSGGLAELAASDDASMHTRSGFGETLVDLHHMDLRIGAVTLAQSPATLTISIESRIDQTSGVAQVRLRDHDAGQFVSVGQLPIGSSDETIILSGIDAANYVNQAGQIELSIKHLVFVPFFAFNFESWIDWVEIRVD